ncbi:MAG: hypothetical protein JNL14_00845 [Devosia sp.]|uniref:hypothetical protein n=1 Tax=Devosia sp. TaxID=1871048 RepID=UPI001A4C01C8|nr:hypothetical protein [Devosia sp.]MBL8596264.1 hypothetical protein [Devosia sp.]
MQDIDVAPARSGRNPVIGSWAEVNDYAPVLKWLLVNIVLAIGIFALWAFGLIQQLLETDRTHVSTIIAVIFALTALHCLYQTWVTSRDLVVARRVRDQMETADAVPVLLPDGRVMVQGRELEPGLISTYIGNLLRKASLGSGPFDQTILLRSLADRLRGRERLGLFVSEGLLRLALLGTAIGFILMLIPLSGLTAFDAETLRGALTGMTSGMAIALNVTVIGIGAALVLKFEYFLLDTAIAELFEIITEATEVGVIPRIGKAEG